MSVDLIKDELFKLLSSEKESAYSADSQEEKKYHNAKYDIYSEYYMSIRDDSSFSYVFNLKKEVLNKVKDLEAKYKAAYEKYNKEKDPILKDKIVDEIDGYVNDIDALNNVYNTIDQNLKKNNTDYTNFSNNIIELMTRINNETDSKVKKDLEGKIYRLNEERRVRFSEGAGNGVLKDVCELESVEQRIASFDVHSEPYVLSRKEFNSALKDTIQAINEFHFLDYKKSKHYKENNEISKEENEEIFRRRYSLYVNKYYSLISSVFNDNFYMIEKNGNKISTDDLINYLSIYNLDQNYEIFRSKNKSILIGNKEINKIDYLTSVDLMINYINALLEQCSRRIQNKTVQVTDSSSSKNDLIKVRDRKLSDIEKKMNGEKSNAKR